MSASNISSLTLASQEVTIYLGIPIFIVGIIGNVFNTIVFLSLRTFRESSCASYLTVMAIVDIGHLSISFLTRIMISGFGIDWTLFSSFYSIIDQFLATCPSPRWQQWSNIKVAQRMIVVFMIIWLLHAMPCCIYFDHIESSIAGKYTCMSSNAIYQQYYARIYTNVFIGFLPILLNTLFGLLAYYNINHLAYRTVPLVRRELDKQLTTIVLTQTLFMFFTVVPYLIINILNSDANITSDPVNVDRLRFTTILAICLYYLKFASPFYVNICASGRFRQQFIYVIFKIYVNRRRQRMVIVNQIAPQT